jgi:hypothetical protein
MLSHFFCISLTSLFTKFPALIMYVISCHALFLSAEVIDEENFAFKTAFSSRIPPTIQTVLYRSNLASF